MSRDRFRPGARQILSLLVLSLILASAAPLEAQSWIQLAPTGGPPAPGDRPPDRARRRAPRRRLGTPAERFEVVRF